MKRYIIGVDEGTTSCRSVLYDISKNEIVDMQSKSFKSFYPYSGWVEQDAEEIWKKQLQTIRSIVGKVGQNNILALGITNQRETVVAWNKETGKPICNAIVWQCRRTADAVELIPQRIKEKIKQKTGLIPDAYFSATKISWILQNVPEAKQLLEQNKLCVGTIDSFLAFKMTGKFVTDTTNASRTMLFNINTLSWDEELLSYFNIPKDILPTVISNSEKVGNVLGYKFPLASMIGDQQSSLFGQGGYLTGKAKATYGTGGFILFNTGNNAVMVDKILTTIGATVNGKTYYALEGSIYSASSTINYMQNNLNLFGNPADTETMANSVKDTNGVYFVPAFTGLGAPYWNSNCKATICGLTFDSNKNHIVRAGLESMAYNTKAILDVMKLGGVNVKELKVDGGCSKNGFLLQFLSNITNIQVTKNKESEATAMGAIFLAGIATKVFRLSSVSSLISSAKKYKPKMDSEVSNKLYKGWQHAVEIATRG